MNQFSSFFKFFLMLAALVVSKPISGHPKWVKVTNVDCSYYEPYWEEGFSARWNGEIMDGKANGTGTLEKYKDGRKYGVYVGSIKEGQIQGFGTYTYYQEDGGKQVFDGYFENGELFGKGSRIDHYSNGQKFTYNGYFVNYMMHGKGYAIYPDGKSFEGLFNMGNCFTGKCKDGNQTIWYYQGTITEKMPQLQNVSYSPELLTQQTEYFDEKWNRCNYNNAKFYRLITYKARNRPQGVIKDYYISGKLQSEFNALYINYDDDHLNFSTGEAKWYYENGQMSRVCNYVNNVIVGEDKNYYENGRNASITTYDNNGTIISHKSWYKSGNPYIVAEYQNGRLVDDRYTEYDEMGVACQVMQENFILNKQTWESEDDSGKSQVISSNAMTFTGKRDNTMIRTNYIQVNQDKDFSIESVVDLLDEKNNNVGYGLILGFKDWSNYLSFIISGDGQYKIQNTYEGIIIPIKAWSNSTAVNKGRAQNLLKVMKIGEKIIFSINGTVVENIEAPFLRGGYYGMLIGGKGNFALENFTYKEHNTTKSTSSNSQEPSSVIIDNASNEVSIDGNGTGFFIDKRGYLATNHHVTDGAKGIYVCIQKEGVWSSYHAIVVKSDPTNDLSIIRIDDPEFEQFPNLPYNFTTEVEDIASDIYTLGYPKVHVMGSDVKYTAGTINSKTGIQGDPTHYQISAHIDHGNSGGPMFNSKGAVIGITDSGLNKAEFGDVNYAIKSSYLKSLIDALPMKLNLPNDKAIGSLSRVEQIKILSKYTALILVDLP